MNKLQVGLKIVSILNNHSFEAYIVGGAVRDYIRNKTIEDVDITTNASVSQIKNLFDKVSLEGSSYLSCRIHFYDFIFETTTFRKDIRYLDHRHPVSEPTETLREDLYRRDFTMNALVMDRFGKIIDYFHGIEDINQGIIRMIGDPRIRFCEDALRVLRALIFSSRMNFSLDKEIENSFSYDYIKYLKEEYVVDMLDKLMCAPYDKGLEYIKKYNLLSSYPVYQVICEEALHYHYKKDCYALFYAIHHMLPANLRIPTKIRSRAKSIYFWLENQFDAIALYYGDMRYLEDAIELYERLTGKALLKEALEEKKTNLPIQSSKDIKISWDKVEKKNRSVLTKKIEKAILLGLVENEEIAILHYLEIEE